MQCYYNVNVDLSSSKFECVHMWSNGEVQDSGSNGEVQDSG